MSDTDQETEDTEAEAELQPDKKAAKPKRRTVAEAAANLRKAKANGKEAKATKKAAAKEPKEAKVPKEAKAPKEGPKTERHSNRWSEGEEAAAHGKLPHPPDFSAKTHERFRTKLDHVVKLAKAGDIKGLKGVQINPISSSPKALDRYRNLCITALRNKDKPQKAA